MADLFTPADCDRHDAMRADAASAPLLRAVAVDSDRTQCHTIRALAAALAESVKQCSDCKGTGSVARFAFGRWTTEKCPHCAGHRELLARMGAKL